VPALERPGAAVAQLDRSPASIRSIRSTLSLLSRRRRTAASAALDREPVTYDTKSDIIVPMEAQSLIREARRRSTKSRRRLARDAGTSAATLAAYEAGRSIPSVETLKRILKAAGFTAEVSLRPVLGGDQASRRAKIEALFAFTDELPRQARDTLSFPRFPASPER